jgi:endonuclease/exonuclease/phosphatase family metal-dependent hydrolase
MRWLIFVFLLARADCFADQFKVATWNLDWFPGKNPASTEAQRIVHMSEAHDALLDVQPDILCLQEVRDYDAVQKLVDVLPRFQVHIVSRFKEAFGGILGIQQTAICGNIPAESAWSESWQRATAGPPRGFSFSAIRTSSGNYLLICSVHFESNLGQFPENVAKREEAARQLLSHAREIEKIYSQIGKVAVVVGGDYNTTPDDPKFAAEQTFLILRAAFSWCWEGKPFRSSTTSDS